jgi:hypothetical protein
LKNNILQRSASVVEALLILKNIIRLRKIPDGNEIKPLGHDLKPVGTILIPVELKLIPVETNDTP